MKKNLFLGVLIVLMLSCTGDGIVEITTFGKTLGSIAGSIFDTNGDPVAVVTVTLTPGGESAVTGSDGRFSFVDLVPGTYTINIRKEGYNSNTQSVDVDAGKPTEAHLTIERIPAIVTADRTELDFGSDYGVTSLSFNIVNNHPTNLEWEVIASCGWIKNILPRKGSLAHGQTGTIIVQIDRENLQDGNNKTVLVLTTTGVGSTEITVKAVGVAKKTAVLNTLDPISVAASFATVNGEIVDPGYPAYTERGFVYSESQMPTVEQTIQRITVPITEDKDFSARVLGLILGKTYYVRAYAVNPIGTAYSSNQVAFTTAAVAPSVSVASVDKINRTTQTAVAHGSIVSAGDPSYTERGFVYSNVNSVPTIYNKSVIVEGAETGAYDGLLSELDLGCTYYVRAYAKNEAGIAYSDAKSFSTKPIAPSVSITKVDNIDKTAHTAIAHGSIVSAGDPSYTERGFVYSNVNSVPTIYNKSVIVEGAETGAYDGLLSELDLGCTYYVRAYAKNEAGIAYSSYVILFSTEEELPRVKTLEPTDVNNTTYSAILHGRIISTGDPAYTERGFVHSTEFNTPTLNDTKIIVAGCGKGEFEARVTGFSAEKSTFVRAYAINHKGPVYGDVIELFAPEWIEVPAAGIAVQKTDIGNGYWDSIRSMCQNSTVSNKTDWRLPTKDELMSLYTNRYIIGDFIWGAYWSSTFSRTAGSYNCYYGIDFSNGTLNTYTTRSQMSGRCVRTLK